jgi:hypothetical protein
MTAAGAGVIAFAVMCNGPDWLGSLSPVVLGNPLSHPEHWRAMAAAFLDAYPDAVFMQVRTTDDMQVWTTDDMQVRTTDDMPLFIEPAYLYSSNACNA